jgi:hypothetical protein
VMNKNQPERRVHALAHFIESDEEIGSNCGEDYFGASQAFDRACELLLTIAQSLPTAQTGQVLEHSRHSTCDGYPRSASRVPQPAIIAPFAPAAQDMSPSLWDASPRYYPGHPRV